ncbi:prepilin-type N-terminal cleavage/methylation domain-containing protein [Candidatus Saccharibacteria bacterium]|nr:prepilin-type N-terminal cleavage/methylation domain-containing protein [Candidatus Saccharibacteria bacterium]
MYRRGFTVVELIIVITIMGILLLLGVVNVRGTQVNGRDDERKADIEAIALNLETFYSSGTEGSITVGRYPSTAIVGQEITLLRDIDPKSLATPGAANSSLVATTNAIQTTAGVLPQPAISQYVYQPLQTAGTLCTTEAQECRKFNLYYRLEGDNTVYLATSKNQ